jgi:hypothetical protein
MARVWVRELSPRSDLEPIQPPILWVQRALSPAVKLTTNLNLVLGSRMADLYIHSPICLHHTVLNNYAQGQLYVPYDGNRRVGLEGMLTVWKIYKYFWLELGILVAQENLNNLQQDFEEFMLIQHKYTWHRYSIHWAYSKWEFHAIMNYRIFFTVHRNFHYWKDYFWI